MGYGIVVAPGAARVKRSLCAIIADSTNELTPLSRNCMQDLYEELIDVEARLKKLDKTIRQLCLQNETCRRILKIPGVGELTATAMVAAVPNANNFAIPKALASLMGQAFLVNGSPQVVLLTINLHKDFINVEGVAVALMFSHEPPGVSGSRFDAP